MNTLKSAKVANTAIVPVTGMVAYKINDEGTGERRLDIIALRVTIYENGSTAWYPVSVEHIASEHVLDLNTIDIYWDYLEYNGEPYGDQIEELWQNLNPNHFPDKVV